MNPMVHFELPHNQAKRISKFYEIVFHWKPNHLEVNSGDYILATTASNTKSSDQPTGAINGGFFHFKPDWPLQYPSIVIEFKNIKDHVKLINKNGGKVFGGPIFYPRIVIKILLNDNSP